jgi:RNA polymerase sigma-70 factor, ECF subfamily
VWIELAPDAVQEAFISAFRRADAYRGEAAVTTWLHRIVVNACLDRLRRVSVRRAGDLGDLDLPDHRDHHAAAEARIDVRGAATRQWSVGRAAVRAATPGSFEREPLLIAEVVLNALHSALPLTCAAGPSAAVDRHRFSIRAATRDLC